MASRCFVPTYDLFYFLNGQIDKGLGGNAHQLLPGVQKHLREHLHGMPRPADMRRWASFFFFFFFVTGRTPVATDHWTVFPGCIPPGQLVHVCMLRLCDGNVRSR